jgi:hypothetical protein
MSERREYCCECIISTPKPTPADYYAILLNDVIILCKKRRERDSAFIAQMLFYLHGIAVYDLPAMDELVSAFQIQVIELPTVGLIMNFSTPRDKHQWAKYLEGLLVKRFVAATSLKPLISSGSGTFIAYDYSHGYFSVTRKQKTRK